MSQRSADNVKAALNAQYVIITPVGEAPGELSHDDLLTRKGVGSKQAWYVGTPAFSPKHADKVLAACAGTEAWCLFVKAGEAQHGAGKSLNEWSSDKETWQRIVSAKPVTGKPTVVDKGDAKVLFIEPLVRMQEPVKVNLAQYQTLPGTKQVFGSQPYATTWATRKAVDAKEESLTLPLVAVARLRPPFAAWARHK